MNVPASSGIAYGALGLPLAFVALPLYVVLPNHYAAEFSVSLAALGVLLFGAATFAIVPPLQIRELRPSDYMNHHPQLKSLLHHQIHLK